MTTYQHWKVVHDEQRIVWVGFDRADETVNTLNEHVLQELSAILKKIGQEIVKGVVIYSEKASGFAAGADVHCFRELDHPDKVTALIKLGQSVLQQLADLSVPTVAAIHGFCLGGGLELSLACRYRIAEDQQATRFGFPEVLLGIQPAWGGAVRLPQLIDAKNALNLMLTGKTISARSAKRLGLLDDLVPKRMLRRAAGYFIEHQPAPKKPPRWSRFLSSSKVLRRLFARPVNYQVAKKAKKKYYPAPYAILNHWVQTAGQLEKGLQAELDNVLYLLKANDTAKNLLHLFFLRERLQNFGKQTDVLIKRVHVMGAGVMGGDIAAWCVLQGLTVSLQDKSAEQLLPALQRAKVFFNKKLTSSRLVRAAMDRLIADVNGDGIRHADIIIEAVFEDLSIKQVVLQQIEEKAKTTALIATNTSSFMLDELSAKMKTPQRLIGIHFFNPVALMQLVEVVHHHESHEDMLNVACAFVTQIKRLPLPVKSQPGFLVNRLLMPYLFEAFSLYQQGTAAEVIDKAAMDYGMVMGPITLADTVGIDICLAVAKNLIQHVDVDIRSADQIKRLLTTMLKEGHLGRKTGRGFYHYKNGKPQKQSVSLSPEQSEKIAQRLLQPMVEEAKRCVAAGIVEDSDLVDAAMVFAAGFAPFRGGPLHIDSH